MNALLDPRPSALPERTAALDDRPQLLEATGVFDEAPQVKTFTFRSDPQSWFRYKPGQFVTLELPTPGGPILRAYALSSSPSRPFSIAVTVKARPHGVGSRWMFEHLRPGDRIRAHGPAGAFTHLDHPAEKYLFLAAGSGAAPIMSMLRWCSDCAPLTDIVSVHCARRPAEILFRRELRLLDARMPRLSVGYLVEDRAREWWSGLIGRIDRRYLPQFAPDFRKREIFCCGPDPFMRAVRGILVAADFPMARYHEESFAQPPFAP